MFKAVSYTLRSVNKRRHLDGDSTFFAHNRRQMTTSCVLTYLHLYDRIKNNFININTNESKNGQFHYFNTESIHKAHSEACNIDVCIGQSTLNLFCAWHGFTSNCIHCDISYKIFFDSFFLSSIWWWWPSDWNIGITNFYQSQRCWWSWWSVTSQWCR